MRAKRIDGTPEQRFWPKVLVLDKKQCWIWQASCRTDGYGAFVLRHGKIVAAHRFSYELAHGSIPGDLWVLHHCDVKRCVNPSHLFLGTVKDNAADMVTKRRHWAHRGRTDEVALRGERKPNAKLHDQDIPTIRARRAAGETLVVLAADYEVSEPTIGHACRRLTWKHV